MKEVAYVFKEVITRTYMLSSSIFTFPSSRDKISRRPWERHVTRSEATAYNICVCEKKRHYMHHERISHMRLSKVHSSAYNLMFRSVKVGLHTLQHL